MEKNMGKNMEKEYRKSLQDAKKQYLENSITKSEYDSLVEVAKRILRRREWIERGV